MRSGGDLRAVWRLFAAILAAITQGCATAQSEAQIVRAATFNIRLDTEADGGNAWRFRRREVSALLSFYSPDFFGLQEVLPHQLEELKTDLKNYAFFGVGRDDGVNRGEFSPIAYRKDRYVLVEGGTFWLSATPDTPSKGWDAAFPRIASWARLRGSGFANDILLLNTHWDHAGAAARLESAKLIRGWITARRQNCETVILLGDFNAGEDEASYKALIAPPAGELMNSMEISDLPPFGPRGTFNGFDLLNDENRAIDHIFVSRDVRVLKHGVITHHREGKLPSDHYPVMADLALFGCPAGVR